MTAERPAALTEELLRILCCPACRGDLRYDAKADTLTCTRCGLIYEVKDGIPRLVVDDARRPDR